MKEEKWEEALRTLEVAFEKTGRSSQDVSESWLVTGLTIRLPTD